MKKYHLVYICLLLCFAIVLPALFGCAPTAPATTQPTAAPTTPAKVYNLKMWVQNPETAWQAGPAKRFIADVEKKTNGQIIITPYWAESLMPGKEAVNGVKSGLFDIGAQLQTFNNPGEFPVSNDVATLPFLAKSTRGVVEGLRALYAAGLLPEYDGKGFKLLDFLAPGMQYPIFKNKQVDTAEGFKGLKMRATSPPTLETMKALGASPVSLPSAEVYMSLDRGVIDGAISSPGFMAPNKWYEVAKFFCDQPFFGGNMFVPIHQKTWDSLTPELQKILMECTKTYVEDWINTSNEQEEVTSKKILKDNGVTFYTFKPGELDKIKKITEPIIADYIKKLDAAGLPGQKIVDTFKAAQK